MKSESATLKKFFFVVGEKREGKKRLGLKMKRESQRQAIDLGKKRRSSPSSPSPPFPHMNPLCGRSTVCTNAASREKPASGACATRAASASSEGDEEEKSMRQLLLTTLDSTKEKRSPPKGAWSARAGLFSGRARQAKSQRAVVKKEGSDVASPASWRRERGCT